MRNSLGTISSLEKEIDLGFIDILMADLLMEKSKKIRWAMMEWCFTRMVIVMKDSLQMVKGMELGSTEMQQGRLFMTVKDKFSCGGWAWNEWLMFWLLWLLADNNAILSLKGSVLVLYVGLIIKLERALAFLLFLSLALDLSWERGFLSISDIIFLLWVFILDPL